MCEGSIMQRKHSEVDDAGYCGVMNFRSNVCSCHRILIDWQVKGLASLRGATDETIS